jgi:hypothetical protein
MSDDWKEVVEDEQVWFVHEEHGNIIQVGENSYIAMFPKVVRLGPFSSLENAKSALVWKKQEVDVMIEEFNQKVTK